ncbi:MAG: thioredoxin fold domain-containing protein [Gammaproteobacteria bacterium]|nr:thioredoxin fold domain-containing protein [Gammaproteobacteria bacterium]
MSRYKSWLVLASVLLGWFAASVEAQNSGSSVTRGEFIGAMPTQYPAWFKESFLEFHSDIEEAAQAGKRVLVLFHQDGCPYCNRLVETNLAQQDIEQYVRENFDVIAVNMWGDREVVTVGGKTYTEKTFAAALRVQFTPTLIFFDEHGKVALRLNGYLPPGEFKVALRYVAEKREQSEPYREYMQAHSPPRGTGKLNAQAFFHDPPYDLASNHSGKPIAVFFEQRDCPNCDTLHNSVLSDEQTRSLIRKFDVVQLDMWSKTPVTTPDNQQTTAREWARLLDVNYAPSIVLFDSSGAEVIRSEAYFKIFHTQSLFDYVASGGYRHEPSFQRFISERAEALRDKGVDVNIWN